MEDWAKLGDEKKLWQTLCLRINASYVLERLYDSWEVTELKVYDHKAKKIYRIFPVLETSSEIVFLGCEEVEGK